MSIVLAEGLSKNAKVLIQEPEGGKKDMFAYFVS